MHRLYCRTPAIYPPVIHGPGGREARRERCHTSPLWARRRTTSTMLRMQYRKGRGPARPATRAVNNGSYTAHSASVTSEESWRPRLLLREIPPGQHGTKRRHRPGCGKAWLDITIGRRVEPHARLLASRWLRHPCNCPGPLTSPQRHAVPCPALPCPALPCPALPCPALPCPAHEDPDAFEPTQPVSSRHLEHACFTPAHYWPLPVSAQQCTLSVDDGLSRDAASMTRFRKPEKYSNSVEAPTYESASYYLDDAEHVRKTFHVNSDTAGRYGRYSNPTWLEVEERLSSLSNAEASLIFASGMAAHLSTFLTFLNAGDEILIPSESYRQVRNLCLQILPRYGITVHEASIRDPDEFISAVSALKTRLRLVHLELPSSPHMYLIDIDRIRPVVGGNTIVTLDSSFAPPPNFYALDWGIDISLFSATKYLGGHGDLVAGVISGRAELIDQVRWFRDTTGAIASGASAALLRRSLYTLELRLAKVNRTAAKVARFLSAHPLVKKVYYTGLEDHPHYALGVKYLRGHGGVVTFELGLSEERTAKFVDRLKIPYMASNFGAPQTLVEQSSFFTYFEYNDESLRTIGVDRSTVRLAVGFTNRAKDIIADLDKALTHV